jgi:hypothetical protein
MLLLGLLLLACTAAFTGLAIADNLSGGPVHNVTILGQHIATMNGLALFCAGLGLALVFALGCFMALGGGMARWRRHRDYRAVRRDAAAVARERDELAARLSESGAPGSSAGGGAPGGARGAAGGGGGVGATRAHAHHGRGHRPRHLFGH